MTNKLKVILFSATLSLIIILLLYIKTQDKEEGFFLSKDINNYDLYTDNGDLLKRENILEYPSVFFFGFLDCPDICPNTLAEISNIIFAARRKKKQY